MKILHCDAFCFEVHKLVCDCHQQSLAMMVWRHLQFIQLWGQKTNKQTNLFSDHLSLILRMVEKDILGLHLRMQSVCKWGMLIIGDAEITSESLQLKTLPQACSKHWLVAYPFRPLPWWVMLQPFKTDRDESMYHWCRKGKGPGAAYDVTNCASDARDMCASLFWFTRKFSHGVCMCSCLNFNAWSNTLLMYLSC